MARLFNAGSDAVVFPAVKFGTIGSNIFMFWIYPLFNQNDGVDHFICDMPMHFGYGRWWWGKFADNRFGGGIWYTEYVDNRILASAGSYTLNQNQWNSVVCGFGGSGGQLYLNGVQIAEGGVGVNPWAGYSYTIGNNSARTAVFNGAIAEMVIAGQSGPHAWYETMSPLAIASHNLGLAPHKLIYGELAQGIEHFFPLWGVHSPEIDLGKYDETRAQPVGTVYGTSRFLPGPPTQPTTSRWWRTPLAACEPFVPPDPEALGGPNAVLVIPDEGEVIAQQIIMGMAQPEDLWLRLFTNDYTPNELTTRISFTEPDGYNYAPITLTKNVDWTFEAGTPTPAVATSWSRTFALTGAAGYIYGFWVEGKVSHKVYWAARYTAGPQYIGTSGGEVVIPPRVSATSA